MKIAFLGDMAFIGKYDSTKHNFESIKKRFADIKEMFDECDYVIGNLESPFVKTTKTKEAKTLALSTSVENINLLKYLGIDAVSLANNHFFDYGMQGAFECIDTLKCAGIQYFGIDNYTCNLKKNGDLVSVGGFCCRTTNAWYYDDQYSSTLSLNSLNKKNIDQFILNSKKVNSYPIVYVHWGEENTHYPKKEHVKFSDYVLSKFKTTIIGHHPHMIQGIKTYPNGNTFFSLGNFCFDDCEASNKTHVSVRQIPDNLKGYFVIVNIEDGKCIDNKIVAFEDDGKRISINPNIKIQIKEYSDEVSKVNDWYVYESKRKFEQSDAFQKRLGKRDIKWLIGHLNLTSVRAVMQRKSNQNKFLEETKFLRDYNGKDLERKERKNNVVLYVGNFDRPDKSAAGKRVFGIAKVLEALEYSVFLLGKEQFFNETIKYSERIYFYSFPKFSMIKSSQYIQWMEEFLKEQEIQPEIVIRYGSPGLAIFDLKLNKWCKLNKIPIITDVVDWLYADSSDFLFNSIKTFDAYLEKAIFNKRSDGVITISSYLARVYKKNRILIVPPLVEKYSCNTDNLELGKVNIVYAGSPFRKGMVVKNVHKIKDRLDIAVEVIFRISDEVNVNFHIYGMTKTEYLTAFPKHKEILANAESGIIFHGIQPMNIVQECIYNSDFTILLREKNRATMAGFPTKVVESLSCGTPVITTNTSDLNKYIEDGENGFFVDINNIELFTDKLKTICLMDVNSRKKLKEKCMSNKCFYYSNYIGKVKDFLDMVNNI